MAGADPGRRPRGHQRLGDITLDDVRAGKVWKLALHEDHDFDLPLEDWGPIEESGEFDDGDSIVYSALYVLPDGLVIPLVQVHEFGNGYGGDYLERCGNGWRQLGLVADPEAPIGEEFIANPHRGDAGFASYTDDCRDYHRDGFARHRHLLPGD